jgi:hypothetical protein
MVELLWIKLIGSYLSPDLLRVAYGELKVAESLFYQGFKVNLLNTKVI